MFRIYSNLKKNPYNIYNSDYKFDFEEREAAKKKNSDPSKKKLYYLRN